MREVLDSNENELQLENIAAFFEQIEHLPIDEILAGIEGIKLEEEHRLALASSVLGDRVAIDRLLRTGTNPKVW